MMIIIINRWVIDRPYLCKSESDRLLRDHVPSTSMSESPRERELSRISKSLSSHSRRLAARWGDLPCSALRWRLSDSAPSSSNDCEKAERHFENIFWRANIHTHARTHTHREYKLRGCRRIGPNLILDTATNSCKIILNGDEPHNHSKESF